MEESWQKFREGRLNLGVDALTAWESWADIAAAGLQYEVGNIRCKLQEIALKDPVDKKDFVQLLEFREQLNVLEDVQSYIKNHLQLHKDGVRSFS